MREAFRSGRDGPVIVLTGHSDYEVDLEATLLGVTDFLIKDQLDTALLERSIRYAVRHHATLAELRKSQERYALAVRGANDGTWDWDLPSGVVYFSSRWKGMLGYADGAIADSPQEWLGRVHPDDVEHARKAIDAHLAGSSPHLESEHRMRPPRRELPLGARARSRDPRRGRAGDPHGGLDDRHHGPEGGREAAAPRGAPRPSDRASQPHPLPRPPGDVADARRSATAVIGARCSSSTSTASSSSTTASATRPATRS